MQADDTKAVTPDAGAATPEQALTQGTSPEEKATESQPQYVTKEEFDRLMADNLRRMKQSDKDRAANVDKKLNDILSRFEKGNAQLSQQQVDVLRQQIEDETEPQTQGAPPASSVTPEMQANSDYISGELAHLWEETGVSVTPNDPEFTQIKAVLDNPQGNMAKLMYAAGKAAETKAARIERLKENADARVIAGGGTTTFTKPMTAEEKISRGLGGQWQTSEPKRI